jgi:hypothetical protein
MNMLVYCEKYGVVFICVKNNVAAFRTVWQQKTLIPIEKVLECGTVDNHANKRLRLTELPSKAFAKPIFSSVSTTKTWFSSSTSTYWTSISLSLLDRL